MAITRAFTDAVAKGDVISIRIMMKDSLLVDPTFRDYHEMARLSENVPGLYDVHDGRKFILDTSAWNDDYMNRLMVQVVGNFSHERLEHLKEVVRYLYPVPTFSKTTETKRGMDTGSRTSNTGRQHQGQVDYQTQKMEDMRDGRIVKIVGGGAAGAVIGGLGAAVAGASTGTTIVCAVVGAAAGGIIVAAVTKGV